MLSKTMLVLLSVASLAQVTFATENAVPHPFTLSISSPAPAPTPPPSDDPPPPSHHCGRCAS